MGGTFRARTIREEAAFSEAKKKLGRSVKRLDEILSGVTWVMARKPESFENVPGMKLYLARTDPPHDSPGLYIWFTFDEDTVTLLYIEEIPTPE